MFLLDTGSEESQCIEEVGTVSHPRIIYPRSSIYFGIEVGPSFNKVGKSHRSFVLKCVEVDLHLRTVTSCYLLGFK